MAFLTEINSPNTEFTSQMFSKNVHDKMANYDAIGVTRATIDVLQLNELMNHPLGYYCDLDPNLKKDLLNILLKYTETINAKKSRRNVLKRNQQTKMSEELAEKLKENRLTCIATRLLQFGITTLDDLTKPANWGNSLEQREDNFTFLNEESNLKRSQTKNLKDLINYQKTIKGSFKQNSNVVNLQKDNRTFIAPAPEKWDQSNFQNNELDEAVVHQHKNKEQGDSVVGFRSNLHSLSPSANFDQQRGVEETRDVAHATHQQLSVHLPRHDDEQEEFVPGESGPTLIMSFTPPGPQFPMVANGPLPKPKPKPQPIYLSHNFIGTDFTRLPIRNTIRYSPPDVYPS